MKQFTILLFFLFSFQLYSQTHEWVNSYGSTSSDRNYKTAFAPNGNIITIGYFNGTVDFDPSTTVNSSTSNGNKDVVICNYTPNGTLIWKKTFGGTGADNGLDITADKEGNIYSTGNFSRTVDFDPSSSTSNLTSNGSYDIYVSKLDSAGNFIWAKSFGGTSEDRGINIKVTMDQEIIVTGFFRGTVDFDPGPGTTNKSSNGGEDIFICKLDSSGGLAWVNTYGSTASSVLERGRSIQLDKQGNIYLCGSFGGTIDFDPGASTYNLTSNGDEDAFLTKLDSSGSLVWAKSWGGSSEVTATSVHYTNNNIHIGGHFKLSADFDPSSSTVSKTSNGGRDIFILKLDSSGNYEWVETIGSGSADVVAAITVDQKESVSFTGYFFGTMDCDPSSSIYNISNSGNGDGYVCQFDKNGDFAWAYPTNSTSSASGITDGIISDQKGSLYIVGSFSGSNIDFDPQSTTANLSSNGGQDAFIQKISDCNETTDTLFKQACNSFTSPSGLYTWTQNGTYYDTLTNTLGCDSIIQINLFITKTEKTLSPSVCSNYISPSGNYIWDTSGTYYDTIPGILGCDSTFTINLTVIKSDTSFTVLACKNYISPSGKSNWNSTGIYQDTILSSQGCDSIMTIILALIQPDTSITENHPNLTSNASGNINYQWLDCNNGYSKITGETSRTFTAKLNGSFSVEVNNSGCTDTSACHQIFTIGIDDFLVKDMEFNVYPNPTNGSFSIQLSKNYISLSPRYVLLDIHGKIILSGIINNINSKLEYEEISKGMYFLQLYTNNGNSKTKRIIIN